MEGCTKQCLWLNSTALANQLAWNEIERRGRQAVAGGAIKQLEVHLPETFVPSVMSRCNKSGFASDTEQL